MEHSEWDIKSIDFGNKALDLFIKDINVFSNTISDSEPYRFCLREVYRTLQRLGEVPVWWRSQDSELVNEARLIAYEWINGLVTNEKLSSITQAVIALNVLAEKRLA
jgi:hypothetical protein